MLEQRFLKTQILLITIKILQLCHLKAILKVAGKSYNVLNVNYGLFQETDATGRPSTITRGGKIDIPR